jgi:hypothetical protein
MATVGQNLAAPESGWKRYDDTDSKFLFTGNWVMPAMFYQYYDDTTRNTDSKGGTIKFTFYGTKLRLIASKNPAYTNTIDKVITIDGLTKATYSQYNSTPLQQLILAEVIGLDLKYHDVIISSSTLMSFDALDIDETGELLLYTSIDAPTNLVATAGDSQITLTWTTVDGAKNYIVKRSTTSGGTYTTIASSVSGTSYVDSSVTNGTTYYYVVTALNTYGESVNSNEASATPVATVVAPTGNALLRVTMLDSSERDYQLTTTEIDGFVNWFNSHTSTNTTSYMLNKKVGTQNSKEYLTFDKIISFEVMEL